MLQIYHFTIVSCCYMTRPLYCCKITIALILPNSNRLRRQVADTRLLVFAAFQTEVSKVTLHHGTLWTDSTDKFDEGRYLTECLKGCLHVHPSIRKGLYLSVPSFLHASTLGKVYMLFPSIEEQIRIHKRQKYIYIYIYIYITCKIKMVSKHRQGKLWYRTGRCKKQRAPHNQGCCRNRQWKPCKAHPGDCVYPIA